MAASKASIALATAGLFLQLSDVFAQQRPPRIETCGRSGPGLGSIAGNLIPDSAGIRLERAIYVTGPYCFGLADSTGRYELKGLPPGTYQLEVGSIGTREVRPIAVRVGPDSVSRIDIHLQPENRVLDCLAETVCAAALAPLDSQSRSRLSDQAQLLEIATRTTIAISGFYTPQDGRPGALCVGIKAEGPLRPLPQFVFQLIRQRVGNVRNPSECTFIRRDHGGELRTSDGLWAWSYSVEQPVITGQRVTLTSSYYVGPLWAAGWNCDYQREYTGWRPKSCRLDWIS